MSLLSAITNIVNGRYFCCLCLKTIERNAVFVQDELFIDNSENIIEMSEILASILGYEVKLLVNKEKRALPQKNYGFLFLSTVHATLGRLNFLCFRF